MMFLTKFEIFINSNFFDIYILSVIHTTQVNKPLIR